MYKIWLFYDVLSIHDDEGLVIFHEFSSYIVLIQLCLYKAVPLQTIQQFFWQFQNRYL
jgi:hypothetical protein